MKINYLFSGVDKEQGFDERQTKYLRQDINVNSTIVFIPTMFDDYDKNDIQYQKYINRFDKIGIEFKEVKLIDDRITKEEAKIIVENFDIVFLLGGSPIIGMNNIVKYDLVNTIKNKNGIVIGVSAGAMNQAHRVTYKDDYMNNEIQDYNGIGIYDMNIYPHLDFTNIDFLKEIFEVSKSNKLVALPNNSFIRIEDNKIEYIGDYYIVEDGVITSSGAPSEEIKHLGTIELETDRLLLRRTKTSDIEEFFYIQLNPKLRKYLGSTKLGSSVSKNQKYFDESKYNDLNHYRWTIVKKEDNKILGTIYLNMHDEKAKTAGIDYWIREDEWSHGYVTEAAKCILEFAFERLKLNRIESCGAKDNPGTWKVMEKIGLKYEGTRRQAFFYYYGGIQDLVLYGISKEEYFHNNKKDINE